MAHSGMDHSGMNGGSGDKMDMADSTDNGGTMNHGTTSGHGSVFYVSRYAIILFQGADTTSVGGLILAFFVVLLICILYELLKKYKAYFDNPLGVYGCSCNNQRCVVVEMKARDDSLCPADNGSAPPHRNVSQEGILTVNHQGGQDGHNAPKTKNKIPKICLKHKAIHIAVSVALHMVSLTISYFIMLVAMTFNLWLFIAVILGSGTGKLLTMTLMDGKWDGSQDPSSHCNMP